MRATLVARCDTVKEKAKTESKVPVVASLMNNRGTRVILSSNLWPSSTPPEESEDRKVAALLLRDAKTKVEQAEENGVSGYFVDERLDRRVNQRLFKGEVTQASSFNKRSGIEALPAPAPSMSESRNLREAKALEREWVRTAFKLREKPGADDDEDEPTQTQQKKRQRLGANGVILDLAALEEAEAKLADEDAELANPLLRPPSASSKPKRLLSKSGSMDNEIDQKVVQEPPQPEFWASKGMRVRIVAESGRFATTHLQKGIVRRRHDDDLAVDIELDSTNSGVGGGRLVRMVPAKLLETVVSKTCKQIEVVRGPHQGSIGELVSRDSRQNIAVIRLGRGQSIKQFELALDDICEFV